MQDNGFVIYKRNNLNTRICKTTLWLIVLAPHVSNLLFSYKPQLTCLNLSCVKKIRSNGNRTEWSPILSVIIRVITKSDDTKSYYQLIIKATISKKRRIAKL